MKEIMIEDIDYEANVQLPSKKELAVQLHKDGLPPYHPHLLEPADRVLE